MPNLGFLRASVATLFITLYCGVYALVGTFLKKDRETLDRNSRRWAAGILRACRISVDLVGAEHLPKGAAILVGNHQGMLDILALMATLPEPPVFAAKAELFKIPIFGQAMRVLGHIPIHRGNRQKAIASINKGAKKLQKTGHQLAFFPEGTRSRDGEIHAFKKGAFMFALESQLPLIPFAINGSFQCCPPAKNKVYAGVIQLRILPPVDLSPYNRDNRDELIDSVRSDIVSAVRLQNHRRAQLKTRR